MVTGTGFRTFLLPPPLNTVTIAICMDLNPQIDSDWWRLNPQADPARHLQDGPFEVADLCLSITPEKQRTNLLILLNAWLDSNTEPENDYDLHTIHYWHSRLRPLWDKKLIKVVDLLRNSEDPSAEKETKVVICNRAGEENGAPV